MVMPQALLRRMCLNPRNEIAVVVPLGFGDAECIECLFNRHFHAFHQIEESLGLALLYPIIPCSIYAILNIAISHHAHVIDSALLGRS